MSITSLIIFLTTGIQSGWIANIFTRNKNSKLLTSLIFGVTGAVFGGIILAFEYPHSESIISLILASTIGAISLLFVVNIFNLKNVTLNSCITNFRALLTHLFCSIFANNK